MKCAVESDEIVGEIEVKSEPSRELKMMNQEASASAFLFRTVRVDDPELVHDLQAAGVEFRGVRPSILSQFLWIWIMPIGVMLVVWRILSRP